MKLERAGTRAMSEGRQSVSMLLTEPSSVQPLTRRVTEKTK